MEYTLTLHFSNGQDSVSHDLPVDNPVLYNWISRNLHLFNLTEDDLIVHNWFAHNQICVNTSEGERHGEVAVGLRIDR